MKILELDGHTRIATKLIINWIEKQVNELDILKNFHSTFIHYLKCGTGSNLVLGNISKYIKPRYLVFDFKNKQDFNFYFIITENEFIRIINDSIQKELNEYFSNKNTKDKVLVINLDLIDNFNF
ncbi:MAG: hypothetical protein QXL18_05075 [Candidatus Woesearchaeota archaeon]